MSIELQRHPDTLSTLIESIEVHVARSTPGKLWLRYHVEVPLDDLALPGPADPVRTNELWQTTCFEMFVRVPSASSYGEYNLSVSSQWAAYRFDAYRDGMTDMVVDKAPDIGVDASESHIALEAIIDLPAPWDVGGVEIALSAVIEQTDGTKSYWALAHPPGAPDFHHPDCFALTLAAPDTA
jgi:hypothetical protein